MSLIGRLTARPGGPFRPGFWRSPIRGPWLTSVFGALLLVGIPIMFLTGAADYAAYNPRLPYNDTTGATGFFGFYLIDWPTKPYWLFRLSQGTHVTLGLVLVPVLLAKLWSVIPKLFAWPPITSPAKALERISLLALVGGAVFEFVTGIMNIQYWYTFPGSFYTLHYYGAWVFGSGFVVHVTLKLPTMVRSLRRRRLRDELRTPVTATTPEIDYDGTELVSANPARPSVSRRGALGFVGAASLTLFVTTVGQSLGGFWRRTAVLAPRGRNPGSGPNGFQINKRFHEIGLTVGQVDGSWRLTLHGDRTVTLTREQCLAMTQHHAALPIACVEGWSTDNQHWTGLRLRDLAVLAGHPRPSRVLVESLQRGGFGKASLSGDQVDNPDSLLAFAVNGVPLSLDHGYPARVIVPNNPGVHNTKWVTRMTFYA